MDYIVYRVMHLTAIFLLFMSFGAMLVLSKEHGKNPPGKTFLMVMHGLAMALIFIAGMGMIAKLKIPTPWPTWIWVKFAVWLLFGGLSALLLRAGRKYYLFWWLPIIIGGGVVYMVFNKAAFT